MNHSSPSRRLAASLLLGLALAGMAVEASGHRHGLGAPQGDEEVFLCPSGAHPAALHVEAARSEAFPRCEACLLRVRQRAEPAPTPVAAARVPDHVTAAWRPDPRRASLGLAGPPGSRGPPAPPQVL